MITTRSGKILALAGAEHLCKKSRVLECKIPKPVNQLKKPKLATSTLDLTVPLHEETASSSNAYKEVFSTNKYENSVACFHDIIKNTKNEENDLHSMVTDNGLQKRRSNYFCNRALSPVTVMPTTNPVDNDTANSFNINEAGFSRKIYEENELSSMVLAPIILQKQKTFNDSDAHLGCNINNETVIDNETFLIKNSDVSMGFATTAYSDDEIIPPSEESFDDSDADPDFNINNEDCTDSSESEILVQAPIVYKFDINKETRENLFEKNVEIQEQLPTFTITEEVGFATVNPTITEEDTSSKKSKRIREKDFCYYCESNVLNFARHIKRNHPTETEVIKIFSAPVKSKERKQLLTMLTKKGNYIQNSTECIKPMKKCQVTKNFLPCTHCLGFYASKQLWRHRRQCCENPSNARSQSTAQNFLIKHLRVDPNLKQTVFPRMRPDKISLTAKKDSLICAFGARYLKIHREKHHINVTSRKMRELAKVIIEVKKLEPAIKNLFHALQPKYFDLFVEATKIVARFNTDKDYFESPTFAMNIGTTLKQCCEIAILYALKKKDYYANVESADAEASLRTMIQLLTAHWRFTISNQAANDLHAQKWNKITIVPLANDLKAFKDYLTKKADESAEKLVGDNKNEAAFVQLLETVFCRVLLLNRKRPGELQRLPLHIYEMSENEKGKYEEFDSVVSPTERILMQTFKRVVIRGKRGRGVPVLFGIDVQDHIKLLLKARPNFILNENPYLFAKPHLKTPLYGYKVLEKYSKSCGAKNPKAITSTRLRKHLATLTQLFNMTESDIEQLASFMGHTTGIHRQSYRLPDDVYQTAKISKLLLLMEKGGAAEYKGKALDEIDVNLDDELLVDNGNDNNDANLPASRGDFTDNTREYPEPDCMELDGSCQSNATENNQVDIQQNNHNAKKKRELVPWTVEQKKIVNSFFKTHINTKTPPKRIECEELISKHPNVLKNLSWLKIKVHIQNIYTKKLKK